MDRLGTRREKFGYGSDLIYLKLIVSLCFCLSLGSYFGIVLLEKNFYHFCVTTDCSALDNCLALSVER